MNRRNFLFGASGSVMSLSIAGCSELSKDSDPMTDDGGLTGFSYLQQIEWDRFGELTIQFAEDHKSDFFTISHEINAGDQNDFVLAEESPSFDGEVIIDFGEAIDNDDREFPSDEFTIDFYTGELTSVVGAVDEHLGSDSFTVPDEVELTGGTTISGRLDNAL